MRDDSPKRNNRKFFKMTKTRTAVFLVLIVATFALVFSITDAHPTTGLDVADSINSNTSLSNNSRLVITNVVKTIEFEVGVVDDDGVLDDNATAINATDFYETDIQLLNVDLLKEVVNQAFENTTKGGEQLLEKTTEKNEKVLNR